MSGIVSGIAWGLERPERPAAGIRSTGSAPDTAGSDDRALLAAIAGGDQAAFQRLYRRHERPLLAFLLRLVRSRPLAEEVLNDTMLAVWRFAARYEGRSTPRTWIYSIAYHKGTSQLQRRQKHSAQCEAEGLDHLADHAKTPEASAEDSSRARLFSALLARLVAEQRTVLQLAYYQEMTVAEIAVVMDCPEGTVKTRMYQARKLLAMMLEEAGLVANAA